MSDQKRYHFPRLPKHKAIPNTWDLLALLITLSLVAILGLSAHRMSAPFTVGQPLELSLAPHHLPFYAARSVLRMLLALGLSALVSIVVGTLAAKNRHFERFIIPLIDVLQSIPILGYLSIATASFIMLFQGSLLGPECAAIFAIFTSQVWNMIFSIYQSLRTVPADLKEVGQMFHLTAWQQFWRIEMPYAMPSFLWNTMMSMSAGWFFVVASEAIPFQHHQIMLPGIGSYIAMAINQMNTAAIAYAIIAMFTVILTYDQILFRPLIKWSEKFKLDVSDSDDVRDKPWVMRLLMRTRLMQWLGEIIASLFAQFVNLQFKNKTKPLLIDKLPKISPKVTPIIFYTIITLGTLLGCSLLFRFIISHIGFHEIAHVFLLTFYTTIRVFILIIICSLIWVPIGVWIGFRPHLAAWIQPIAQFLAAFPANLLFPFFVSAIVIYHLNPNIWTAPLMILGTQWYILFNVIAGVLTLPKELHHAALSFNVSGWLWWRRLVLPAIFPYVITGALSAAGGAWNASILAEYTLWGDTTVQAQGIGAYISNYTLNSDFPRIALGITVMCIVVILINRLFWQPLYRWAETRFHY